MIEGGEPGLEESGSVLKKKKYIGGHTSVSHCRRRLMYIAGMICRLGQSTMKYVSVCAGMRPSESFRSFHGLRTPGILEVFRTVDGFSTWISLSITKIKQERTKGGGAAQEDREHGSRRDQVGLQDQRQRRNRDKMA
jgi:hypothetical protein